MLVDPSWDHFRLLGHRGPNDPPLLSDAKKITDFSTRLEVLGWILDTQTLTVTMPLRKQQKLHRLLGEWPRSRLCATARQVAELTGFLLHVSFALRPGKYFVGCLLADVGMPQSDVFPSRVSNPARRVVLGPMFHDDLDFGAGLCSAVWRRVADSCVHRCTMWCFALR